MYIKKAKLPFHKEHNRSNIARYPSLRHPRIEFGLNFSFPSWDISPPYLSRDSFGRQDLHPSRIDFHHMHDGIAENDTPQLLVRSNLRFDIVLRPSSGTLVFPQHNQAASVRQRARRDTPYWSLDWCDVCTQRVILSPGCFLWLCIPFAWLRGR